MTKEIFDKKRKQLEDEYIRYALIRNDAMKKLSNIVKKIHKLEDKFLDEHPEFLEDGIDE